MKISTMLTVSSLLSILLFSIHMAFDIVHGVEPGNRGDLTGTVLIELVWLYAALLLAERRSGAHHTPPGSDPGRRRPRAAHEPDGDRRQVRRDQRGGVLLLVAARARGERRLLARALLARPLEPAVGPAHENPDLGGRLAKGRGVRCT